MPDQFDLQPETVTAAATGLRQAADALAGDVRSFLSEIQGQIQAPGIDLLSPLIWAAHDAVLEVALEVLASNLDDWYVNADKLDAAVTGTVLTEQGNAQAIGRLQESL